MHFVESRLYVRKMLNGLAGNDQVEAVRSEWEILGVALSEGRAGKTRERKLGSSGAEGGRREVATSDLCAVGSESANKAATAASHFQYAKAGNGAEVFTNETVPGAGCVIMPWISVVDALMPNVVGGTKVRYIADTVVIRLCRQRRSPCG
jgi:hypothetical protein